MNEEALKLTLLLLAACAQPEFPPAASCSMCASPCCPPSSARSCSRARALTLTALSVAGCVFFEWAYRPHHEEGQYHGRPLRRGSRRILVAFVCPVTLPFWTILIGDFFASSL